jgi:DNA repair photolyase
MPAPNSSPIQRSLKGRGAAVGAAVMHRFERVAREAHDDGWGGLDERARALSDVRAADVRTSVRMELAKSAITTNDSPDISFDAAVNPYRGCEHGCVYCYARPTHSYLGLSPGLDFETQLIAKSNIAQAFARDLAKPSYKPQLINIGSATDCYQPVERELKLTRSLLEVAWAHKQPVAIVTKSALIERDLDLIAPMAAAGLFAAYITITSLDAGLIRALEPRAAAPSRRLATIRKLVDLGVPVGVSVAPQIPFVNEDMEAVLEAAAHAGASRAFYTVLRLPWELNEVFQQWLQFHMPDRAERIMNRVREMRGGKDYDSDFATRMKGSGVWADLIRQRFEKTCARLGLNRERVPLQTAAFGVPDAAGGLGPSAAFTPPAEATLFEVEPL